MAKDKRKAARKKSTGSKPSGSTRAASHAPSDFGVVYHDDALREFAELHKDLQKPVLSVGVFLRALGPRLVEPHCRKVQGARKLWELRPGGGRVLVRPLYAQVDGHHFVVFAIGPEAEQDRPGFDQAVARAQQRAKADYGLDV